MVSKWKPGTRVRVKPEADTGLAGKLGTIEAVDYAALLPCTSVILDDDKWGFGIWFADDELDEVTE